MGTVAARHDPDVEAAVLAHYGVRTRDVSLRELRVLMDRLPPGVFSDPDRGEVWSPEAHLLAGVIDALNDLCYLTILVNTPKEKRGGLHPPKPLLRPGGVKKQAMSATDQVKALAAMLGGAA